MTTLEELNHFQTLHFPPASPQGPQLPPLPPNVPSPPLTWHLATWPEPEESKRVPLFISLAMTSAGALAVYMLLAKLCCGSAPRARQEAATEATEMTTSSSGSSFDMGLNPAAAQAATGRRGSTPGPDSSDEEVREDSKPATLSIPD